MKKKSGKPAKSGRRNQYTPETHAVIVEIASKGGTQVQMAAAAGVRPNTVEKWLSRYPELRKDVDDAKKPDPDAVIEDLERRRSQVSRLVDHYIACQMASDSPMLPQWLVERYLGVPNVETKPIEIIVTIDDPNEAEPIP